MKKIVIILFLFAGLYGCNRNSLSKGNVKNTVDEAVVELKNNGLASVESEKVIRNNPIKLIKKGELKFEVKNLDTANVVISKILNQYNCYIANDNFVNNTYSKQRKLEIRIANNEFDRFVSQMTKAISNPEYAHIETLDVSEKYVDLQARLKAKKETLKRFLSIMQKAQKITDVLEVEREISEIQTEIEQIEGQLKYLNNRISFSNLKISITQYLERKPEHQPNRFVQSFKNGWRYIVSFILLLINIWPFLVLGIVLSIIYKSTQKNNPKK